MRRWLAISTILAIMFSLPALSQRRGGGGAFRGGGGAGFRGYFGGGRGAVFGGGGSRFGGGFRGPGVFPNRGFLPGRFYRPRFGYGYPWWWSFGYAGGYYSYPGYYGYSYPSTIDYDSAYATPPAYYAPPAAYNDLSQEQQERIERLQDQVDRLRDQRDSHYVPRPPAAPQPQASGEAQTATVLVFRDKHTQEVRNYAVVGQTLWIFNEQRATKLPLTTVDIPATTKANDERGVDFRLPE